MGPLDDPTRTTAVTATARRWVDATLSAVEDGVRAVGHRLIQVHPSLAVPLVEGWYLYVGLYIRGVALRNALTHVAPIEPFRIYWVDPNRLTYYKRKPTIRRDLQRLVDAGAIDGPSPPPRAKFKYVGRVVGGDWDRDCARFEDSDLYRAFEAHFERGVPWEETAFFDRVVEEIEDGRYRWGCRSRAEFERRCRRLDRLYHTVQEDGYRTQAELASRGDDDPFASAQPAQRSKLKRFVYDEMTVSVGRDGEFIFNDGHDRLAIAKLLGLEAVPVWIMLRHTEWQRLRDEVATGERDVPAELRTHPDLAGVGD